MTYTLSMGPEPRPTATFPITVEGTAAPIAPTINNGSSMPNGKVGEAYSQTLSATAASAITWSLESGTLPAGLTLAADGTISGTYTFTVKATANGVSSTKELTITIAAAPTVTGIAVKTQPTKTVYTVGEELDLTGLTITVTRSDGSTADIPVTVDMISGYDKTKPGTQTVTITYEGKAATFTVTVNEVYVPLTFLLFTSPRCIPASASVEFAADVRIWPAPTASARRSAS